MIQNNIELRVLVKGRPINEYPHMGETYVEGRDSSEFEIEVRNLASHRVEAVISVDGLSVIDGKDAGPESSGYLLEGRETIRIPGWKLSDEQVAAFVFAGKQKSYVTQSTGSARNTGVIGVLVYSERKPQYDYNRALLSAQPYHGNPILRAKFGSSAGDVSDNLSWASASPRGRGMQIYGSSAQLSPSSAPRSKGIAPSGATTGDIAAAALDLYNMAVGGVAEASFTSSGLDDHSTVVAMAAAPVEQTLGTGFGKAQDFRTSTVSFERGDLQCMMVLYYDDSRGLRARGIELKRPSVKRERLAVKPQAFPGMNCKPPPGWEG